LEGGERAKDRVISQVETEKGLEGVVALVKGGC
jgi:hypothetical protein